jgi:hypothetical protein
MCTDANERSSRWRLDGLVPRAAASSDRYHHLSGEVRTRASTRRRIDGNRASKAALLRALRKLLRILYNLRTNGLLAGQLRSRSLGSNVPTRFREVSQVHASY